MFMCQVVSGSTIHCADIDLISLAIGLYQIDLPYSPNISSKCAYPWMGIA